MIRSSTKSIFLAALIVIAAPAAHAEFYQFNTDIRGTLMWVPPGMQTVRGVLVWGNGAGADERSSAGAPWLQQFAQLHGFALIGTSMWGNLAGGEINTWDQHIAALAQQSGHPELKNAPLAPMGFSNGGQMSYGFNARRPEKTIAFITNKGCCYNNTLPPAAALKTPGILIAGELDTATRRDSIRTLFDNNRARGALWSWVEQQGMAHQGVAQEIMMPFMDEAIRLRYPANQAPTATTGVTLLDVIPTTGWLADQSTWHSGLTQIDSYDSYSGNKQTAGWLLDQNVAFMYRAFSTYNHDVRLTFVDSNVPGFPSVNYGFSPGELKLQLDVSGTPGWTKVELFNGAQSLLQLAPAAIAPSLLTLNVTIPTGDIYGLSALVTHADGHTFSTTNLLVYTALPEPTAFLMLLVAVAISAIAARPARCGAKAIGVARGQN